MQQIICDRDNHPMQELFQCTVQGVPTFRFQCPGCGGIANVQVQGNHMRQVNLNGNVNEYRPNGIRPGDMVDHRTLHQPAYSLGSGMSAQQRAAYSQLRHAMAAQGQPMQPMAQQPMVPGYGPQPPVSPYGQPLRQPVAYTLGQHPQAVQPLPHDQLRRRIMGIN